MGQIAPPPGEAESSVPSPSSGVPEPLDEGLIPLGFIHGSETVPPRDTYYVNDYPYSHPAQIDYICVGTICALVMFYALYRRLIVRQNGSRLLKKIHDKVGRARPFLVAIAFFVILEGVLTIAVHFHPISRYRPDPVSLWSVHVPFSAGIAEDEPTMNSMCLANDELPLKKPAGAVRILSLGDSRTLGGAGTPPPQTYPRVLEGELRRANEGVTVEVIWGAQSGYSSYQGLLMFKKVGPKYEPHIVTVALGYQDKERSWSSDAEHMSDSYALSVVRGLLYKSNLFLVLRKNLLNLTKYRRNRQENVRGARRVSLEDFKKNISSIIELARAAGTQVVLIEMPFNPYTEGRPNSYPRYREALRETALQHAGADDVHYLDLHDFFWRDPLGDGTTVGIEAVLRQRAREYFVDDCHMKPNGHRAVALYLLDFFRREEILSRALDR